MTILCRTRYGKQPWKYYLATEEQAKEIEVGVCRHNDERDYYGRSGYYDAGEFEEMNITDKSIVYIENIWLEDLFKWFYEHVMDSGGDGGGAIICKNYEEVSEWFIEWWKAKYNKNEFFHPKGLYNNSIYYGQHDEYFMFSDDINFRLFDHEYIFIIKKDCISSRQHDRIVLAVDFGGKI